MKIKSVLWPKPRWGKFLAVFAYIGLAGWLFMAFIYNPFFEVYTGVENAPLTYESSKPLSDSEFEALALELTRQRRLEEAGAIVGEEHGEFTSEVRKDMLMKTRSFRAKTSYDHIEYFREAGIRQYEGPKTCLTCHETMKVPDNEGGYTNVNTMEDVLNSIHFKFQSTSAGFTTYGYDGRKVNEGMHKIPVGKIDRACGIPGSFSWTGWAAIVEAKPAHADGEVEMRSEGCGQCHIGGNYHPATEKMMPIGNIPSSAEEGVDCLICHSDNYDMNYRHAMKDENGIRWNQDRTMRAAMTVGQPKNENCLNCHQHNMGGDAYAHNVAAKNLGYKNKRLLHPGAKRGNPFSYESDVHYRAGLVCLDCHEPEGHKIPRGTKGTDLVGNDLPGKVVACENCHTSAPHTENPITRVILNGHTARIACETCHITHLEDNNVVLRDWVHPTWHEEEGIWTPTDILWSGQPGRGFTYLWFNGNGTFLANALGANPNKNTNYNPLQVQLAQITDPIAIEQIRQAALELKKTYKDLDVDAYVEGVTNPLSQLTPEMRKKRERLIEEKIRPLMNMAESKIYPFKLFNAMMYEDMSNQGPYGAMILPFDYATYYETGDPKKAVQVAIQNPIVKRMYEFPFKAYMMDEFMAYFGVDEWKTEFPLKDGKLRNVEPHWMRQMGSLMVNHGISREAHECQTCHAENGIMDFEALGYRPQRVKDLQNLPELQRLNLPKRDKTASKGKKTALPVAIAH
ncbi:MAG: nitrite reductase [Ectothiorhodospiraceae bacterium]|nr:nitrite reductase [Ectothiorhodospiraceae bacterium]